MCVERDRSLLKYGFEIVMERLSDDNKWLLNRKEQTWLMIDDGFHTRSRGFILMNEKH
jgi:hypothetical protein